MVFSSEFYRRVEGIERDHRMVTGDLLRIMQIESGLRPDILHGTTKAAGFIQIMPSNLKGVGWLGTPEGFANLSAVDQMPYVRRYFARFKDLPTLADAYASVFWPVAVGAPDTMIIASKGGSVYALNAVLDVNGDGVIQKGELDPAARRFLRGSRWRSVEREAELTPEPERAVEGTWHWVQAKLLLLGLYNGDVDGIPGPATQAAIKAFQKKMGLGVDGIVGPATTKALRES